MSQMPKDLQGLSPEDKRALLAELLKQKTGAPHQGVSMSYGQRALWYLHRRDPHSAAYNVPWTWSVRSVPDVDVLRRSLQTLVDRHPILRTNYVEVNGAPAARVRERAAIDFEEISLGPVDDAELSRVLLEEAHRPFDLERGPVLRIRLLTRAESDRTLLVTIHHIAYDLWSMMTLLDELGTCYRSYSNGETPVLPPPRPYDEFIRWQADMLAGPEGKRLWDYWGAQMAGDIPPLTLPIDRPRAAVQTSHGATHAVRIPAELGARLRELAQSTGHTLFTLLLSAFDVLLSRYSGEHDIVVGSPLTGRTRPDLRDVVGFCLNNLPLRTDLSGDPPFTALLDRTRQVVLGALEHQDYPFALLVERLRPKRDPSHGTLFHAMFALNKPHRRDDQAVTLSMEDEAAQIDLGGLVLELRHSAQQAVVDDLVLLMSDIDGTIGARWQYRTDLFDEATIVRMAGHFERLLESIVAGPDTRISMLSIVGEREHHRLTHRAIESERYPAAAIHELFEEQVRRSPGALAVFYDDRELTYAELNRRANKLARFLRKRGVGDGTLVGLFAERSFDTIVGMIGILKCGAAYVPLDPSYPQSRLAVMIEDSATPLVLTQESLVERIPEPTPSVCLDRDWSQIDAEESGDLMLPVTPEHTAYVIYTSGSTGRPKGVVIPHRGVVRLVRNTDYITCEPSDRVAQASNASFDAATFEIWLPLLNGASVIGIHKDVALSPGALAAALRRERVSVLFLTTALFNQIIREAPTAFGTLRSVLFGGEAVDADIVREALANSPPEHLLHVYGPTESTTFTSWYRVTAVADDATTVPIGGPIAHTDVYVLDRWLQPVPIGVPGELYIGGNGLAHGYLARPELTAEKFVPDPFSAAPGQRLYRTGDLVRWRDYGCVEFLGRADNQVKIRGFRIEPGEVEAVLRQHRSVREALVDVRDLAGAGRSLVAYVVPQESGWPLSEARNYLRERLPDYMVPSAWVALDAFPLTPNGKVNRAALPSPEGAGLHDEEFVAPQPGLQAQIAAIWRDVLQIERVGTRDNFFDLGGHSLLVIQVHARIGKLLGREIPVVDLFRFPTIDALAQHLVGEDTPETPALDRPLSVGLKRSIRPRDVKASDDAGERDDIAIVAIAGRFPGARDVSALWDNLRRGVESIRVFTEDELRQAGVDERLLTDARYVRARAVLDDADLFDAAFFGYNPRDAELIDPQQRIFLETACEALERAGYDPERYDGRIGVYAGASASGYALNVLAQPDFAPAVGGLQALIGSGADFLATRVSYKLNLRGPSVTVQTACSTSLVAVHHACRSLRDRECDMALAGGVSVGVPVVGGYLHQDGGIMSPDGHCRAFDANARGTVAGHGVGIVVLKRLADALADGDTIQAVIRGTAINNDGADKIGYTAPSVEGQADVIASAQAAAGVDPASISYIEAHGTGTALGDPIEFAALRQVFGQGTPGTCSIGSLKTNVGHLDAAAGVASLIKTTLALTHGELPPSLHYTAPNPKIDFAASPFFVNASLRPWRTNGTPRRAGVSSFGIGGTNAHAIVEEAPPQPPSAASRPWQIVVLSAKTASALDVATENLARYLSVSSDVPFADVAYTLQVGRREFAHRGIAVCRDSGDAASALSQRNAARVFTGEVQPGERSCVFLFSGQGAQYAGMAQELYQSEPTFRDDVDACCDTFLPHLGWDLRDVLTASAGADVAARLKDTAVTQPALFVVEYALARLLMRWGVRPSAMAGHSIGEYAAACLAGVFSLHDALRLVAARGRLMQAMPPGAMLAVPLAESEVTSLLGDELSLAAVNGPALCVVAGPMPAIAALEAQLAARGLMARRLETSHAFHSAMMEPALDAFRAEVASVKSHAPLIPIVSNVTGTWLTNQEAMSPDYWTRHLRQPVRFSECVRLLLSDPAHVFLEVGPGRTLTTLVRQQGAGAQNRTLLTTLRGPHENKADLPSLLEALGRLWIAGLPVDWPALTAGETRRRVVLPTYPFERRRYWIDAPRVPRAQAPVEVSREDLSRWFYEPRWKAMPVPSVEIATGSRWLIFADEAGIGDRLARYLSTRGHVVVTVAAGDRFGSDRPGAYTIDPANAEHYRSLVDAVGKAGGASNVIAHFWGVTTKVPDELSGAAVSFERGFQSLMFLAQAVGETGRTSPLRIGIVTSHVQAIVREDENSPSKATVLGMSRVIPAEYAQVTTRAIDIAVSEWTRGDAKLGELAAALVSPDGEPIVGHREGEWWTPTLEQVTFGALTGAEDTRLRESGVYLVTGGLGGVGLTIADYLARTVRARLVLIGRTALPPRAEWPTYLETHAENDRLSRKIRALQAIENAGGEVFTIAADVADDADMASAVRRAREQFGRLDGVIHAAGVGASGIIQTKSPEMVARVFAPKVAGSQAIARAIAGDRLDFLLLCSSMTSFFGGGGQADYCAANAYLDAFARYYARRTGTFTVSVNWDTWQQVGMAVETELPEDLDRQRDERLKLGIAPGEGAEAFARILGRSASPQIALSTVSLAALARRQAIRAETVRASAPEDAQQQTLHPRPDIGTSYAAPADAIEQAIASVWQHLLGIERIGREDNFFDLGGHSLLLVQAHAALVERLGRTLPVTDLFQFPTIRSLAAHLAGGDTAGGAVVAATSRPAREQTSDIAIVGMAGRFPGAPDLDAFWRNLRDGVESIDRLTDQQLRERGATADLLAHPRYVKAASTLDDVDLFDAGFFGYAPREAELIDPQHRVFLECAWEALERAGYDPKQYSGLIGVYAGAGWSSYLANIFANPTLVEAVGALQAGIGNRGDHLPTRVSYKLNLRGPSLNVQTACSTSLVAVHQACRSLVDGECDMALAGGVSISLSNRTGYLYIEEGIGSPDGHCRAFDANARGTVWGDGVGVVVLKRLADALTAGDTIHAVIRGTAINNDGAVKVGYTAPSVEGQAAVIARAQAVAGIEPSTIGYIEAHGTGTTLGDPIEIAALTQAFGSVTPGSCAIGTVKTNLGHLDAAAGVAGLIKTALALEHAELPPSLNFETPNPKIDFESSPFFVNTRLTGWPRTTTPRRAGVSSFGIGGTNAHAVLEEAPAVEPSGASHPWQLLVVSAQSHAALDRASTRLAEHLTNHADVPLADVAYTLQVGRRGFAHRRAIVCSDPAAGADALRHPKRAIGGIVSDTGERSCVFLFSGQGTQYVGMARGLYRDQPSFRADVDECCERLEAHLGCDLRQLLYPSGDDADAQAHLTETRYAQPALFVVEYALARLWIRWGLRPSALMGHSIGEYVAACVAGVFSLEDALMLVAARGRLMQELPAGAMLAVSLSEEALTALLGSELSVAAVNAPNLCVASGPSPAIADLEDRLASAGVTCRRLETSHAFHSGMMEPAVEDFAAIVAGIARRAPQIPFVSNVTGTWITEAEATDPRYWARHLRSTVRFAEGAQELLREQSRVFVEIGPGRALATLLRQQGPSALGRTIVTSVRHPKESQPDHVVLLEAVGRLWAAGLAPDWTAFWAGEWRRRIPLPTYPFERRRYWIDAPREDALRDGTLRRIVKNPAVGTWFYVPSWTRTPAPALSAAAGTGAWLVFLDEEGVGERLVQELRNAGRAVSSVRAGARFEARSAHEYQLNPGAAADYDALLRALRQAEALPRHVAHLWSIGRGPTPAHTSAQDRGFYSVLFLVQALARVNDADAPLDLTIVGDRLRAVAAGDQVVPAKCLVLGLSLVIPQEHAQLRCGTVDVSLEAGADAAADLAGHLYRELAAGPTGAAVAYRGAQRFEQVFEPATIRENDLAAVLREDGVYLITGGLGNIGLAIADRLARTRRVRLVLVGRTTPPRREEWQAWVDSHAGDDRTAQQIAAIRALEKLGADVLVAGADVADPVQIQNVVATARARFGAIHGIIHTAGVVREAALAMDTVARDACEAQLAPKVAGTLALADAIAGLDLDFCLLTSSLSSVLGGLGFAAYAAANQFLDSFAEAHTSTTRTRWISVNLDGWSFESSSASTAVGRLEMLPAEGVESLARILCDPVLRRVAVSTADLPARIERYVRHAARVDAGGPTATAARYARPEIATDYHEPADQLEETIAEVWQHLLGIDRIGRDDNFFDLGGHSLMLVQVHDTLAAKLARAFPVTDLFQYPTIATLAAHLGGADSELEREAIVQALPHDEAATSAEPIAIIGMAGRFPGAPDVETFWQNLRDGIESIRQLSDDELRQAGIEESLLRNPRYVRAVSLLDDIDLFDASFFGYSPREADLLDPQQRLFLECAWEALERAGCDPKRYSSTIGVYAGATSNAYLANIFTNPELVQSVGVLQATMGSKSDHLTTRVSYKLNLRGPSLNVQTACSTSLVAVHAACRSLLDRECDMALAGGVSVSVGMSGKGGYLYVDDGILSPDGHCRAFDAKARGTIWGDGVGVVVLKRLREALADGDTIHAVIRGTAINNDGGVKVGYTAPSVEGQAVVIAMAQASAGIDPATISYVEAHGTGTSLGDPIEVAALRRAFGQQAPGTCALGTLKTNMGHLDAAAGVAGLIKTVLALEHGELPPSLHFETPNPKIEFEGSPFYVNTSLTPWRRGSGPRRAGVSSFGMGGTNAHAVIEEAPARTPSGPSRPWQLLVVSAQSRAALDASSRRLADYLATHTEVPLADVAYTLQVGRQEFAERRAVVCRDGEEASDALRASSGRRVIAGRTPAKPPSVAFLFPGQGAQHLGMARDLYRDEPIFRAIVDDCAVRLQERLGVDLRSLIHGETGDAAAARLTETRIAQPAVFVIEYALASLWRSWGIEPHALLGHSIGEYAAACLAGVFTLEDALTLVAARGQLMQDQPPGAMLAIELPESELEQLLRNTQVSIAAINGPSLSVVSGPLVPIQRLEERFVRDGVSVTRLHTSHAFHSWMMDDVVDEFVALVARVQRHAPLVPVVSNLTGTWITDAESTDPSYWGRHLRQPVRFAAGVDLLLQDSRNVLLEVGPGRALGTLVRQHPAYSADRHVIPSLPHPQQSESDSASVVTALGRLWTAGVAIDWTRFYEGEQRRRVVLPTYPFERKRYWVDARPAGESHELPQQAADLGDWFYVPAWKPAAAPVHASGAAVDKGSRWVVFADDLGGAARVAEYLASAVHDVVLVHAGQEFHRDAEDRFTIDPRNPSDYHALLQALKDVDRIPDVIAHLWGVTNAAASDARETEICQSRGFYSLLFLAQALGAVFPDAPVRLGVVTTGVHAVTDDEVPCAAKATVLGPCRVIPTEYPQIACRAVDIDAAACEARDDRWIEDLIQEITAEGPDAIVAYRRGRRWVPIVRRSRLEPVADAQPARLRSGGVYLITGGLGGVGLTIGSHLADTMKATLVLTSRRGLPDRKTWAAYVSAHAESDAVTRQIRAVQAMEASGGTVSVVAADVSNVEQIQAVVRDAVQRYGRIDGVIHSAGVPGGGVIQLKTPEAAARVLAPKVSGTLALSNAVSGLDLDFIVLCSSLTSLAGGGGQVDYCAANAYLDAFARQHARQTGIFTVAIDWDAWRDVGMAVDTAVPERMARERRQMLEHGIEPQHGIEALRRILDQGTTSQIIVSRRTIVRSTAQPADSAARIEQKRPAAQVPAGGTADHDRPDTLPPYVEPTNDLERAICEMWQSLLGISRIGIHDDFFELGGHSLLATQLVSRLRQTFDIELRLADLFEATTVSDLSHLFMARLLDEDASRVADQR